MSAKTDKGDKMFEIVVNPDNVVGIPQVGTFVENEGEYHQILKVTTIQELSPESPNKVQFTTKVDLLPVNDEGDDLGKEVRVVIWDESYQEL
jgi:hypothetical protein